MRRVIVEKYQSSWKNIFDSEKIKLASILRTQIVEIHHIGSTSIPNLSAKPVIDIMVVVKNIEAIDKYNKEMLEIGYDPKGENGITNRRFYQKGGDNRTHHVHIFQLGDQNIQRHLAFRDYLIKHPNEAKQYSELKSSLASDFPYDIALYIKGKEQLVLEIERKALEFYKDKERPLI